MPKNRIVGYDLARGLSLFGMLIINYWCLMGERNSDPQWLVYILGLIQGRSAALFVVLAGIGISLLSRQACMTKDADVLRSIRHSILKRALFLYIIGLLNCILWPSDILHFYGVYFAIGACLLSAPNHRLGAVAILSITTFSLLSFMVGFDRSWDWDLKTVKDLLDILKIVCHLLFSGQYPVFPWLAFLITGMWLGRQNLYDVVFRRRCLLAGLRIFVVSESLSWIIFHISSHQQYCLDVEEFLLWLAIEPWEPMPLFVFSAIGTSCSLIIVSIMLAERFKDNAWLLAFSAVGRMTLTLYIAHILLGWVFLQVMDLFGWHMYLFTLWGSLLFYTGGMLFACQWKNKHERGPLEWAMRRFALFSIRPRATVPVEV